MQIKLSNHYKHYLYLMRLQRPVGILLLLWPTLWALWIAGNGRPDFSITIIFILGVIVMRSAGCVINDIADRDFDGFVARTKDRPLAAKKITVKEAIIVLILLLICALILALSLNRFALLLAFVGLAITFIYPLMKRYMQAPQLILGMAFAWGVPMAFAAQTNTLPAISWLIFLIALLWPIIYDTMYAMADMKDDLRVGIKSTAILFGNKDRLIIAILQVLFLGLLFLLGKLLNLDIWFYISLSITALLFCYQQYLIKERAPSKCFKAFLNNQWVGGVIFAGIVLSYL